MNNETLQAYYDAHDAMMDAERGAGPNTWALLYGAYKVARYNAARAGLISETPQFDVETAR